MTHGLIAIQLTFALAASALSEKVLLPMGQEISLELAHFVTSAYNPQDSRVFFRVAEDVVSEGQVVVRRGEIVVATVMLAEEGGGFGRAGEIELAIRNLRAVDGTLVPLDGRIRLRGRDRADAAVAPALVFGVVGALETRGRSAVLGKGELFEVWVGSDREILPGDSRVQRPEAPALEISARAISPKVRIKIEKQLELDTLDILISPPAGATFRDVSRRGIEIVRVAGVELPAPIPTKKVLPERGAQRAYFDRWQVASYCDPGRCELELQGRLIDGRKWLARAEIVFVAKQPGDD